MKARKLTRNTLPMSSMDRRIRRPWLTAERVFAAAVMMILLTAAAFGYVRYGLNRALAVDSQQLTLSPVAYKTFHEYIPVTGHVVPRATVYLDAVEGGQITEVFVEEGAIVEAGQPLVRMKNSALQLQVIASEAQLTEQLNYLATTRLTFEQNRLNRRRELLEIDHRIENIQRRLRQRRPLTGADGDWKMIRLSNVTRLYRTAEMETRALAGIDLNVQQGEFVAVMGPSGCGKSTLLNIVGLIDSPTSGHYYLGDEEIAGYSESRLAALRKGRIGFIFQSFNLIDELNVYENVELPLLYQGIPGAQRRNLVREALELVDLSSRARHRPEQLSGGQQQRAAVARAVVNDPSLILADEPTGNLDTKNGDEVMGMLKTLHEQGATILMVTHSPGHSARADRIVNLLDGRIVAANELAI